MALRVSNLAELDVLMRFRADTSQAEEQTKKLGKVANEMTVEQLREYTANQSRMINGAKELERETARIQRNWWRTQRVLRASAYIFRDMALWGGAIWAPLLLGISQYVKKMESLKGSTDELTKKWTEQTSKLQQSRDAIARTTIGVLLPYLEKATELASKISSFTTQHPQTIEAALKIGAALVAIGTLGALVTSGVKLIVDVKFVAATIKQEIAAFQMNRAADKQLAAAGIQSNAINKEAIIAATKAAGSNLAAGAKGAAATLAGGTTARLAAIGGTTAASGAGAAGALGFYGVVGGFVALGTAIAYFTNQLANQVSKVTGLGDKIGDAQKKAIEAGAGYPGIDKFARAEVEAGESGKKGASGIASLVDWTKRLEKEGEGARIILELQRDLLSKSKEYEQDRADVLKNSAKEVAEATKRYTDTVANAYSKMVSRIGDLTTNYNKQAARSEEDWQHERQNVVKDGNEQIIEAQKDLQKKLRDLREEHGDKVAELLAARDALGLVKEEERYQREVDKATEASNEKIAKERQETADRLKEIDYRYKLERRRRYEDYIARVAEARAQYEQDKKDAAAKRKEELEQIQNAQKEKLDALQAAYDKETKDAVNAAYEKIVLLQGAYDAELKMRQLYNQLILDSTGQFLNAMLQTFNIARDSLVTSGSIHGSAGVSQTHQLGGYTKQGLSFVHAGEYVLDSKLTKLAEQSVGGMLNNRNLAAVLGGSSNVTVQVAFPGGLITKKELNNILDNRESDFAKMLTGALYG